MSTKPDGTRSAHVVFAGVDGRLLEKVVPAGALVASAVAVEGDFEAPVEHQGADSARREAAQLSEETGYRLPEIA